MVFLGYATALKHPVLQPSFSPRRSLFALLIIGEMSYQFLSLLAKTLLGGILLANVLVFRSFDEAVLDANSQM